MIPRFSFELAVYTLTKPAGMIVNAVVVFNASRRVMLSCVKGGYLRYRKAECAVC